MEMLEKARRLEDFDGLPKLKLEKALTFFEKAAADAKGTPEWLGELYLELHRGTFTTQAKNKLENRRSEFLLRDAEYFDSIASLVNPDWKQSAADPARAAYDVTGFCSDPADGAHHRALDRAWKLLLLNQFHDIIPGSSIRWVYEDSARDYEAIRLLGQSVLESGFSALSQRINTERMAEPVIISNTLGFERTEVIDLPDGKLTQVTIPPFGYAVIDQAEPICNRGNPVKISQDADQIILENGLVRISVNQDGHIHEITDLRLDRQVLHPGSLGNVFSLYSDIPNQFDAWDVDIFHKRSSTSVRGLKKLAVGECTPFRASVTIVREFGKSTISQRILLRAGSARIDFPTEVDWQEDRKFLKVAFPVNVRSARATYEVQFGHIERPTHANTSWDMAKFEVCAHKWADLSESGLGVSLLNDCKYGYDIHGNTVRLSLLRSPVSPDPRADRGHHRFTYSLLSHGGDFRSGGVIQEAYALNVPLLVHRSAPHAGPLAQRHSFLSCTPDGVIIETVKKAEDGNAMVIRLYEAYGARGSGEIHFAYPLRRAAWTDLLERETQLAEIHGDTVAFSFRPFEIMTLKVEWSGRI